MEELDQLEGKLRRLKREYDLFVAGQRKTEPAGLRAEVEREVLRLSRQPLHSTAARFRMGTLAHRFRALETQIRNVLEQREGRAKEAPSDTAAVVVDRASMESPATIERHLRSLHKALAESLGGRPVPSLQSLRATLLEQARPVIERPDVRAVRFTVSVGEAGPKIRGEVLLNASTFKS